MTRISIIEEDKLTTISIVGHSGYSASGSDIVCASISTAFYYMYYLLYYENIIVEENIENGNTSIKIPTAYSGNTVRVFMDLMFNISDQYPLNVEVKYERR